MRTLVEDERVATGPPRGEDAFSREPNCRLCFEAGTLSASIQSSAHQAWVAFCTEDAPLVTGDMESDGRAAVVRRMPDGSLSGAVLDGSTIEFEGETVSGPDGSVLQL